MRVARSTVQPVPLKAVAVSPRRQNASTSFTVPVVGPEPELVTVMVYVSPVSPLFEIGGMGYVDRQVRRPEERQVRH